MKEKFTFRFKLW